VHYHLKELLQAELIVLSHKQEKSGIMEKYYLPVAKKLIFALDDSTKAVGTPSGDSSHQTLLKNLFDQHRDAFLDSKFSDTSSKTKLVWNRLKLTEEQRAQLFEELEQLYFKWSSAEEGKDTETMTFFMVVYKNLNEEIEGEE
jgi:hypothetical protein